MSKVVTVRRSRPLDELTDAHRVRLNIGRRYWGSSLDSVPDKIPHKSPLLVYQKKLVENRAVGFGLYLWGDNSVGKTYVATAILQEACRLGFTGYAITADELKVIYIEQPAFGPEESVTHRVEAVDFLLIDDLGKEYSGKGSGWAELCFENLLRKRSRELRPTLVTTNLSMGEFQERYKQSAAAIAMESMLAVNVKGPDMRLAMAKQAKSRLLE